MIEEVLRWLLVALLALPAFGADWVEYRSGPFHIFSDAGDRHGREALTELEQLRFVLGATLGGASGATLGTRELTTIWPIDVVLFANQKEYAPHALPKPLIEGGSATLAAWSADVSKDTALPHDLLRALTLLLIEDNADERSGRLPEEIETALADLMSTVRVNGTLVSVGAPLAQGEIDGDRLRAWAKLQMVATQPEYAGKLRVYLNNLQQSGEEGSAVRNAYDTTAAKLNEQAAAYLRAGKFEAVPVTGRALAPSRDFIEKDTPKPAMQALIAELDAQGKTFPPDTPRALLAQNTLSSLELAAKANARWAEPHFKMAALETDRAKKIADLKAAASLAPRNPDYWQTLATAQAAANLFADAEKSWTAAERAAPNPAERARIHQAKLDLQDERAAFDVAERQREKEEEARDLQRVKDAAAAEVHAAEQAANARLGANRGNVANPVPWIGVDDSSGTAVSGSLTRVDCLAGGSLRLTILQETGRPVSLLIRDPKKLTVAVDSNEAVFVCGVQKPARQIEVRHDAKADAKLGTLGDIAVVKFP
ncbi:MAG TPA: hypothetical protein VGR73_00595 [Bryobacteraceae bacterium]|nr:hypothetical protein [Bryobacteraceae bacterium]